MRTSPDEAADGLTSERRCVLSGAHGGRETLIRLALGPDGEVAPDLGARAGGRGAWLGVDRATLGVALVKGKLRGALARAFKTGALTIPDDLAQRIETGLAERARDRLGLENRAGNLISGTERIEAAIMTGAIGLLVSASDAGADGLTTLRAKLRTNCPDARAIVAPVPREALSRATGRANTVHLAVRSGAAAARVAIDLDRWRAFLGLTDDVGVTHPRPAPAEADAGAMV